MTGLELLAPAKVNLALEVLRRRPDGYHEIDTVITTLSLHDRVRVHTWRGLEVRLSGRHAAGIDPDEDLAARAARALAAEAGREPDALIEVEKRIPQAAGLGGGSSDAAAVLRGLHALWGLDWPLERLEAVAARLGSDVPFFLHCGVARCTGRGERVEPLRDLAPLRLLIAVPPVPARPGKTAQRYAALTPGDWSDGHRSFRLAQRIARRAPPPTNDLVNAFEPVIERTDSELLAHYARYRSVGIPRFHLCGAGPAVYCFVHEHARTAELRRELAEAGADVYVAETLGRAAALAMQPLDQAAT